MPLNDSGRANLPVSRGIIRLGRIRVVSPEPLSRNRCKLLPNAWIAMPGSDCRDGVLALIVRSRPMELPFPHVLADHRPGRYS
jgi:hypothetical protein